MIVFKLVVKIYIFWEKLERLKKYFIFFWEKLKECCYIKLLLKQNIILYYIIETKYLKRYEMYEFLFLNHFKDQYILTDLYMSIKNNKFY